jgi:uncharacterized protein involved in type VI secretion and phage assembly
MPNKFLSHFTIKINGANVDEAFYDAIEEVTVDSTINMPSMFSIKLRDSAFNFIDNTLLDLGKEVEIGVEGETDTQGVTLSGTLTKGEITALEPQFSALGITYMCVRGYDKSHRLHLNQKTRTFLKQKDSDMVSTVVSAAGLSATVEATTIVHEYVIQYNQTDWEFILWRAEMVGYVAWFEDGNLNFKKRTSLPTELAATLEYAERLISFQPRYTASQQASKVVVKGWDPKTKKEISTNASANTDVTQGGGTASPGSILSSKFTTSGERVMVDQTIVLAEAATKLAEGTLTGIGLEYVQAEGTCFGHPKILAGKKIKITNVGTRFSGEYYVTSALHVYNRSGYQTHFSISGRNPLTLSRLVGGAGSEPSPGRVSGVVPAIVTNIKDPDNQGKIKVKFPWLDDQLESHWIRVATPMAGNGRGLMLLPEVNDEVLVAFEHGDSNRPYMLGALWNGKDAPPLTNNTAAPSDVDKRIFKTRAGHILEFDDTKNQAKVTVKTVAGQEIVLDDAKGSEKVTVKDKGGNTLVMDGVANSMSITVKGDFQVDAKGKITLKSVGGCELTASGGATTVKGTNLTLEGMGSSQLKGASVSVQGTGSTEVKSSGILQIQGSLVKIN